MMRPILFVFFLSSLGIYTGYSQQYQGRHYTIENGLTHNTVYSIYKDQKGFMVFCTETGICTFDGHSFKSTLPIDENTVHSSPLSVTEDNKGNKLVCTLNDGLLLQSDTVLKKYRANKGDIPAFISSAAVSGDHTWFIGRRNGEHLYNISDENMIELHLKKKDGSSVLFKKIVKLGTNCTIVTSDNGLYKIDGPTIAPFLATHVSGSILDIKMNRHGQYVIGLENKIAISDSIALIREYPLAGKYVSMALAVDNKDNIWAVSFGKAVLLANGKNIRDIGSFLPLKNLYINDVATDREGNIWLATYNEGVCMIPSTDIVLLTLKSNNANTYCHSIKKYDSASFIVGSIGCVSILRHDQLEVLKVNNLNHDEFVYFAERIGDYVYIGTPHKLIRKNVTYPFHETLIKTGNKEDGAISICHDKSGNIWVGGYQTLFLLRNNGLQTQSLSTKLANKRYNCILSDTRGSLWFGTDSGLIKYDGAGCRTIQYGMLNGSTFVHTIAEDSYQRIWAGTTAGLVYISPNDMGLITRRNGLNATKCYALCEDSFRRLWVGTPKGLNYIDLSGLKIHKCYQGIGNKDGLSICTDGKNTIFVGSTDNIVSINTNSITEDNAPPPVFINYARTTKSKLISPTSIALEFNENKIIIDFIAISFNRPEGIEYRYKVTGIDDTWHITTNSTIELASLPSGNYDFVLNARKDNGPWSNDVRLAICVSSPFWKQYSFLIVVLGGLAYCIYLFARRQTQKAEFKKREKLVLLNKIAYLKQQALSALINPHFIFNCMNSIQHFLNRQDNEKANTYLADFASLIRLTMEHAQEMYIPLQQELNRLRLYLSLEQLRFGEGLRYEISVARGINENTVIIPNMIIQPYIENAIWHGIMPNHGNGLILLSITISGPNELKITIEDNGIGLERSKREDPDTSKKHYGMNLTEERLKLLKQISGQAYSVSATEITDKSNIACGTRVEIVVPLNNNHK